MANYTTNYNLKKPLGNENYNIENQNGNMDIIEENFIEIDSSLAETPKKTLADITYYVATTGLDTNDGLTVETAFKTIQYAIDNLPQAINHSIYINVSAGTYSEDINILGFIGKGSLYIGGTTTTNVNTIAIKGCQLIITIFNFTTIANSTHSVNVSACIYIRITDIITTSVSASANGINVYSSLVLIKNCTLSNKNNGIYASDMSTVYSYNNSGSGNAIGLSSLNGSTIGKYSVQPTGTTAEQAGKGGIIR